MVWETKQAARPRRNQLTEAMRQSNPRKNDTPSGLLFRGLNVMPWFDKRQERAYSGFPSRLLELDQEIREMRRRLILHETGFTR